MKEDKNRQPTSLCGLDCYNCPAYIATITNDDKLRGKTAKKWNKRYQLLGRLPITKDDINCSGCLFLSEPLYKHCRECGVRKCGLGKGMQNCGECSNYKTCPKIFSLHRRIPEGRKICEIIREKRKQL